MKKTTAAILISALVLFISSCSNILPENSTDALIEKKLSKMTTEQKIGQLFCVSFAGTELSESTRNFLKEYSIGNVILFSKNIFDAEQTAKLCKDLQSEIKKNAGVSAFIGTDQEGGQVIRVTDGASYYPSAMAVAAAGDSENAETIGRYMGEELRALGINIDFAPVADINSNPDNPVIGTRSYGDNALLVSEYASAFAHGMKQAGEISTAKHYPGHGDTEVDSHFGLPTVDKSLDELMQTELVPFKRLINEDIDAIMAAHIIYPQLDKDMPASMSRVMLTDILRDKLGFEGMIITDGLRMGAVADSFSMENACIASINAGADLLITGSGGEAEDAAFTAQEECIKAVQNAVLSGEISEETLNKAAARILKFKEKYKISDYKFKPLDDKTLSEHSEFSKKLSRDSITLISDNGLFPIKKGEKILAMSYDHVARLDESEEKPDTPMASRIALKTECEAMIMPAFSKLSAQEKADILNTYKKKAKKYDKIIVCLSSETHIDVANAVFTANPNTIAIAVGSPYLLKNVNAKTKLCAYEYTENAADGIIDILLGNYEPSGILPVKY